MKYVFDRQAGVVRCAEIGCRWKVVAYLAWTKEQRDFEMAMHRAIKHRAEPLEKAS